MTYEEWLESEMTIVYAGKVVAKGKIKDLCTEKDETEKDETENEYE